MECSSILWNVNRNSTIRMIKFRLIVSQTEKRYVTNSRWLNVFKITENRVQPPVSERIERRTSVPIMEQSLFQYRTSVESIHRHTTRDKNFPFSNRPETGRKMHRIENSAKIIPYIDT